MRTSERRSESGDLSEAELRIMLEARELELEQERQRVSRKFSKILIIFTLLAIGSFLLFSLVTPTPTDDVPMAAIPLPATVATDPEISEGLKKFTALPGDRDLNGDIQFAGQLLNFVNPSNSKPPSTPKVDRPDNGR